MRSCFQGVTYCGESSASSLTMANVPWHQEVVAFVQQLADMLPQYEIACEHEHSNCLLIAHTKVRNQNPLLIILFRIVVQLKELVGPPVNELHLSNLK